MRFPKGFDAAGTVAMKAAIYPVQNLDIGAVVLECVQVDNDGIIVPRIGCWMPLVQLVSQFDIGPNSNPYGWRVETRNTISRDDDARKVLWILTKWRNAKVLRDLNGLENNIQTFAELFRVSKFIFKGAFVNQEEFIDKIRAEIRQVNAFRRD